MLPVEDILLWKSKIETVKVALILLSSEIPTAQRFETDDKYETPKS